MHCLCIYLPRLPLEVFQASEKPCAVIDNQRILLCNHIASNKGIEPGLTVSTALALHNELLLVERNPGKEQQLLADLAELAYQFSSHVVAYKNHANEHSILLEIGRSLRLFGGLDALLEQLATTLHNSPLNEHGFRHHFGLAHSLPAAELLARYHPLQHTQQHAQQNTGNNDTNQLARVPVQQLDCHSKAIQQCIDIGLTRLGDVLALPRATLGKRFDESFIRYLNQLQGLIADPRQWFKPRDTFLRELLYLDGLRSHSDLQVPIQKLLAVLCSYLTQRQLKCARIVWLFTRFSKKKHRIEVSFSQPQSAFGNLFELSQLHLAQLPLDSPVESVGLQCQQFIQLEQHSNDFFVTTRERGDFNLLADKLVARLGENSLWQLHTRNNHLPELANSLVAFAGQSPTRQTGLQTSPQRRRDKKRIEELPLRPAWLWHKPLPIQVKNQQLLWRNNTLALIKGPERLQCNWWSKAASRDYFIAGLTHGSPAANNLATTTASSTATKRASKSTAWLAFYWIYYDRQRKQWFLHGEFA